MVAVLCTIVMNDWQPGRYQSVIGQTHAVLKNDLNYQMGYFWTESF